MNKGFINTIIIGLLAVITTGTLFYLYSPESVQLGGPSINYQRSLIPIDSTENLGTTTAPWDELHVNEVCLSTDCKTTWPTTGGGAGSGTISTSSDPTIGHLPFWTSASTLGSVATTSATCSGSTTCDPFTVIGASPVTITSTGGSGSTGIGTSTNLTAGHVVYATGIDTVSSVATGTLSTGTGLTVTGSRSVIGGSAIVSADTGYVIPLLASTTDWQTAFGWGDHSTEGYLTGVAWGDITGTLSSQIDLAGALAAKIGTSTALTAGSLLYATGINTVAPVATTSLTATSPLSLSQPISVIGSSASALTISTSGTWSGNAGTATALAANGSNCSAGSYPLGVDASGASEDCTDATTEINSLISTHTGDADAHQALVTLAGSLDYLTISGQAITRNAIDLATDVTGILPSFRGGSNWNLETNFNALALTPTTTIPVWFKSALYASSTATFDSAVTLKDTLTIQNWLVSTSTTVCANNCQYTSIQTALNAGHKNIVLKEETYAGPVSIIASDTTIKGAGMNASLISCSGTGLCVSVATSSPLTRITLEDFGIVKSGGEGGVGLDTSDTSNVYTNRMNISNFTIAHYIQDTFDQTFYSSFNNMRYSGANCVVTGGTLANNNTLNHTRCIVTSATGIGYDLNNVEGWLLNSVNSEPGSVIGTALQIDGSSIGVTVINPWFEGNATGTEILSGAINTKIINGRITANTRGIWNRGVNTDIDNVLVTANTTNLDDPGLGVYTNITNAYGTSFVAIGTTTQFDAQTRLALGNSTSASLAPQLWINNAGAFAAAFSGIGFGNSAGNFAQGVAKIGAEPGSGYANSSLKFLVADSSKTLQERMRIDVNGNLGLGTSSPSSKLDVGGHVSFVGPWTGTGSSRPVASLSDDLNAISGVQMINVNTGTAADFRFVIADLTGHYFTFSQPGTGNTGSALFGLSRNTTDFIFNSGGTGRDIAIGSLNAQSVIFGTNNTERMRVASDGNVGIGTTSPYAKLSVVGEVVASHFTATSSTVSLLNGGAIINGSLQIPNGAAPTVDAIGEIALRTSPANAIVVATSTNASFPGVIPIAPSIRFTLGSTTWTSTTTAGYLTLDFNERVGNGICHTDAGTVLLRIGNGTTYSNAVSISTATTSVVFTSGNYFPKNGVKVQYQAGTPASSPTAVMCSFANKYEI